MESQTAILEKEIGNDKSIYLYETLDGWRAFERSAFHFIEIFKTGKLILSDDLVVMDIDEELSFLQSPAMCLGEVILVGDSEVHFECNESLGNFDTWRSNHYEK